MLSLVGLNEGVKQRDQVQDKKINRKTEIQYIFLYFDCQLDEFFILHCGVINKIKLQKYLSFFC